MTALWLCPLDCNVCHDPDCLAQGCRRSEGAVLVPCELCGELHELLTEPELCKACREAQDADELQADSAS